MLVKIEERILIFPGTDLHFPSTSVPPGTFLRLCPPPVIIMNDPFRLFLKIRITVMAMVTTRTTTTTRHDDNDNNKYRNNLLTCIVNVENQNVVHVQSSFYNKTTVLWDTRIVFLKVTH